MHAAGWCSCCDAGEPSGRRSMEYPQWNEQLSTLERTAHEENRESRLAGCNPITFFHFEPRNR